MQRFLLALRVFYEIVFALLTLVIGVWAVTELHRYYSSWRKQPGHVRRVIPMPSR